MHTLNTQSFIIRIELNFRKILFLLCRSFSDSPVEIIFRHKIRQTDDGDPPERILPGIINADHVILPPEPLQRRHHIIKISLDLMAALLTHPDRKRNTIQTAYRLFVLAFFIVWIPAAAYRNKIHFRYSYY